MRSVALAVAAVFAACSVANAQDLDVSDVTYPTRTHSGVEMDLRIRRVWERSGSAQAWATYGGGNHTAEIFDRESFTIQSRVATWGSQVAEVLIEADFTVTDPEVYAWWSLVGPGELHFVGPTMSQHGTTTAANGAIRSDPLGFTFPAGDYSLRVSQVFPSEWWIGQTFGWRPSSEFRIYFQSAVIPEPSTWWLVAAASCLLLFWRRRHRC